MLLPLRLRSLLKPVDDRLIRNAVGIVKYLDQLRERLDNAGVGIAIHLNGINEPHFGFGAIAESFEDGGVTLQTGR